MSFTPAVFKIITHLQKLVPPPYHINPATNLLHRSTLHCKPRHRSFRLFSTFSILIIILPLITVRSIWLFFNWNSYTVHHVQQAIVYGSLLCCILTYIPVFYLDNFQCNEFIFLINQICLLGQKSKSATTTKPNSKMACIRHVFVYQFAFSTLQIGPAFCAAPFLMSYFPLQLIFGSHYVIKCIEAALFGSGFTFGALRVLHMLLFGLVATENLIHYT